MARQAYKRVYSKLGAKAKGTPASVQERALGLQKFISGQTLAQIARELGRSYSALELWSRKYDWAEKREKSQDLADQKAILSGAELMADRRNVVNTAISKLVGDLETAPPKTREGVAHALKELIRQELTMAGLQAEETGITVIFQGMERPTEEEIKSHTAQVIQHFSIPKEKMN